LSPDDLCGEPSPCNLSNHPQAVATHLRERLLLQDAAVFTRLPNPL